MSNNNDDLPRQPSLGGAETERIHDTIEYTGVDSVEKPRPVAFSTEKKPTIPEKKERSKLSAGKNFTAVKKEGDDFDFLKYISTIARRRRIILLAIAVFTVLGLFRNVGKVDQYQAETKLLIQLKQQNPVGQFDPGYFWDRQTKINTMLNTLKSREVLQRVVDRLGMHLTPAALGSRITTERQKETNIIRVNTVSEIPEEAALISNTLAQVFVEFNNELNRKDISDALEYIERQIVKTEKELREKEEALKVFVEKNEIIGSEEGSGREISKLSSTEAELRSTMISIVESEERLNRTRQLLKDLEVYVGESYTFDNSIEAGLIKHNVDLANALAEYGEKHYKVRQIRESIRQLTELAKQNQEGNVKITSTRTLNQNRQELLQTHNNLTVSLMALKAKKVALENVLKEATAIITQIPAIQLEYHRLRRDKLNIEQVYQLLQTKYQEQRIRYEMQSADIVQWEAATVPKRPLPQGSKFGLIVFVFVGAVIGIGLAFLLEFLDQTVKNPQEVEDDLSLPILGIIPLMDEDSKVIDLESKSSILEPYRSLRTNIRYTNVGAEKRVILVTSAIQGDGKTTKVCNLAISFALDGKKVVVVDCDLRRASVHRVLGVEKEPGLSDYLSGQATIEQIRKNIFNDLITVIPAGKRPPNPAELLGNSSLDNVIQWGIDNFDIVLVDSPAIVPVSDALLLVPHVDSVIIIGRSMKTPKKAMQFAKNSLLRAGANIIGAVFNGVVQRSGYYPYYYSYYSYYSYYKSKYYYYDDDNEMEKLPKNFKEFLVYSMKQLAKESRSVSAQYWKKLLGFFGSKEISLKKKFLNVFLFLASICAISSFVVYKPFLSTRQPRSVLPANYRYYPVEAHAKSGLSYQPKDEWFASSAKSDAEQSSVELRRLVEEWREAWQSGNEYEYRKYYSPSRFAFKYGGYQEWMNLKDSSFRASRGIRITIDSLRIPHISDSDAVTIFYQGYSDNVSSTMEYDWKQLKWFKERGFWKITREGRRQ